MSAYHGIYTGIVVDNTGVKDVSEIPSGKVLVHIDGITPTRLRSQRYKGLPASNVRGTLDVETTKKFQVLAKVMMPIINESSPGIYNANDNTNTPTRSVPANQYKQFSDPLRDAFSDQVENVLRKNNTYGHSYTSDYRGTGGMGVFAVPEPGTRVRVMFENGNLSSPIVIGQVNTSDEFAAIFRSGKTYPTLPKASQNYFKSSKDSTKDESPTAKGRDAEIDRFLNGTPIKDADPAREKEINSFLTGNDRGELAPGAQSYYLNSLEGEQSKSLLAGSEGVVTPGLGSNPDTTPSMRYVNRIE